MIRELICYKCECAKCGHSWTTKAHELPLNCAKCKSTKWNDDYDFSLPQTEQAPAAQIVRETPAARPARKSLAELQEMINGITAGAPSASPVEPIGQDWRWSKDRPQYDEATGKVFRQQWLFPKGKPTRNVEVDEDDIDRIIRIVK